MKQCKMCGSTNWIEKHHIVYRSEGGNNDNKNLIHLCKRCHMLVHSNKKKYQPVLMDLNGIECKSEVKNKKWYCK